MSYELHNFADGEVLHGYHLNAIESGIQGVENTVQTIQNRIIDVADIADLRAIINYKKDISCKELLELESCEEGTIYRFVDTDENIEQFNSTYGTSFTKKCFVFCRKSFSTALADSSSMLAYWSNRVSFLQEASKGYSGIVTSEDQEFSGKKSFEDIDTLNITSDVASFIDLAAESLTLSSEHININEENYVIPKEGEVEAVRESVITLDTKHTSEINSLIDQIDLLRKDLEELQSNTSSPEVLQQQVKNIDKRLQDIERLNLSQELNDLWSSINNVVDRDSFETLEDAVEDLETAMHNKVETSVYTAKIQSIDTSLNSIRNSLSSTVIRVDAVEADTASLKTEVTSQKINITDLQSSVGVLSENVAKLEEALNNFSPENPGEPSVDSEVIKNLQAQITGLSTEIEELNGRITEEIAEVSNSLTEAYTEVDTQLRYDFTLEDNKLSSRLSKVESTVGSSTSGIVKDVNELETDVKDVKSRLATAEIDIDSLQSSVDDVDISLNGDENSEIDSEKKGVFGRLSTLEASSKSLSGDLESVTARVTATETTNTSQASSISINTANINSLSKKLDRTDETIKTNKKEAQDNLEASYGLIDTYTQNEYNFLIATGSYEINRLYAVNSGTGTRITKIYLGSVLLAMRDESGNTSFPYTFPIRF